MIETLVRIGDQVAINVSAERRAWAPFSAFPPNGTVATVVGWKTTATYRGRIRQSMPPGRYEYNGDVRVALDQGAAGLTEGLYVAPSEISLVDKQEYEARMQSATGTKPFSIWPLIWMAPLPDTPFWEDDVVRVLDTSTRVREKGQYGHGNCVVKGIDYLALASKGCREDGTPFPVYQLAPDVPTYNPLLSWSAHDLELVTRGNVWRAQHNEPLVFADLAAEIKFRRDMRHYREILSPLGGPTWKHQMMREALEGGLVDIFLYQNDFGKSGTISNLKAIRFDDPDLGARVRQDSLARLFRDDRPAADPGKGLGTRGTS